MPAEYLLLSDAVATWTDKEVLIAVGKTIAVCVGVCLLCVKIGIFVGRRRRNLTGSDVRVLQEQLTKAKTDAAELKKSLERSEGDCAFHLAKVNNLTTDLDVVQTTLTEHKNMFAVEQRRFARALAKDGHT